ncbi:hypothetical protein ABVT39_016770 [Epinephelus coioides]
MTTAKHLIISLYCPVKEVIIRRRGGRSSVSGDAADIVIAIVVSEGPCEGVKAGPLNTRVQAEQAPSCGNYRPPPWSPYLRHIRLASSLTVVFGTISHERLSTPGSVVTYLCACCLVKSCNL